MSDPENADRTLAELLQAHGIEVDVDDAGVWIRGEGVRADATLRWHRPQPAPALVVQLDVSFDPWPGASVRESFAGVGATREAAIAEAFRAFSENVLHVLLAAFVDPGEPHVARETWTVAGEGRDVVRSEVLCRGRTAIEASHAPWLEVLKACLASAPLGPGTHWLRFFYSQDDGASERYEALLDNEPWGALERAMQHAPLPSGEGLASVRFFAVLREPGLEAHRAAALIAARADAGDAELVELLVARGAERALAERCVAFFPSAFGRALVGSLGVSLPDEGVSWPGEGLPARRFRLADDPVFAEATAYALEIGAKGPRWIYEALTRRSAELRVVNEMLHRGARPADLVLVEPTFLHLAAPCPPEPARRRWWQG